MKKKAKKIKKEIKLDDLALRMERGFEKGSKDLDDLALMVGKGFNEMGERFERVDGRLTNLKKGVEEIKTDLSRRVHIFDHKELEFRVERLEEKAGIAHKKYKTSL